MREPNSEEVRVAVRSISVALVHARAVYTIPKSSYTTNKVTAAASSLVGEAVVVGGLGGSITAGQGVGLSWTRGWLGHMDTWLNAALPPLEATRARCAAAAAAAATSRAGTGGSSAFAGAAEETSREAAGPLRMRRVGRSALQQNGVQQRGAADTASLQLRPQLTRHVVHSGAVPGGREDTLNCTSPLLGFFTVAISHCYTCGGFAVSPAAPPPPRSMLWLWVLGLRAFLLAVQYRSPARPHPRRHPVFLRVGLPGPAPAARPRPGACGVCRQRPAHALASLHREPSSRMGREGGRGRGLTAAAASQVPRYTMPRPGILALP